MALLADECAKLPPWKKIMTGATVGLGACSTSGTPVPASGAGRYVRIKSPVERSMMMSMEKTPSTGVALEGTFRSKNSAKWRLNVPSGRRRRLYATLKWEMRTHVLRGTTIYKSKTACHQKTKQLLSANPSASSLNNINFKDFTE